MIKREHLLKVNAGIFTVVALLHLWRSIAGLPLYIGALEIPAWGSYLAVLLAGYLAYANLNCEKCKIK